MSDTLFIDGARGGAGATACAVRLGYALAASGERTLLVDGDAVCADGLFCCGMQGLNVYTLADVERGACRVKQALLQHPRSPNFYILPSLGLTNLSTADDAVKQCEGLFDFVICDKIAAGACRRAVLVTEPYPSSLKNADKKSAALKDRGFKDLGLIVNKVNGGLVFGGDIMTPQEISAILRAELWGVIPEDLSLPLGRIRPATQRAFSMTARYVMGGSKKIYGVIKPYAGLKGIIKRKMRERI